MSEFMGLIKGGYEAKEGFQPGGASLHSIMTPHGPDKSCYKSASKMELKPERVADGTLSFMFETYYQLSLTEWASTTCGKLDKDYNQCWVGLRKHFIGPED